MEVRIINHREVEDLLRMQDCVDLMEEVLMALGRGEAILPLRPVLWLPDKSGALALMPAYLKNPGLVGVKVISVFPGNTNTPYDSHQGTILLFDPQFGRLVAIVDASSVTAIRTAAASGAATRKLARQDAGDLAILGAGVQAKTHLEAMMAVRNIRRVRVWSRNPEHLQSFVTSASKKQGVAIEAMSTPQEAVIGADLICTTTASTQPVVKGEWISAGAHINAVGACFQTARELDTDAVVRSRLFVDRLESALNEAGDFLIPKQEGAIGDDHILGEIGDVFLGRTQGRSGPDDITIFKSLGIAVEDLISAHFLHLRARELGKGASIELGGARTNGAD
jgi:ornithine cyclodeaminase/alanine dehydrogenase-like protein (mu-crystallin family)